MKSSRRIGLVMGVLILIGILGFWGEIIYYLVFPGKSRSADPARRASVLETPSATSSGKLRSTNLIGQLIDPRVQLDRGTLIVDNRQGETFLGYYGEDNVALTGPFRVRIEFLASGETKTQAHLRLSGKPAGTDTAWWEDIKTLFVTQDGDELKLELRDGSGPESVSEFVYEEIAPGEVFYLEFFDSVGDDVALVNSDGKVIDRIKPAELTDLSFPQGLFPDHTLWVGLGVAPGTKFTVEKFNLEWE